MPAPQRATTTGHLKDSSVLGITTIFSFHNYLPIQKFGHKFISTRMKRSWYRDFWNTKALHEAIEISHIQKFSLLKVFVISKVFGPPCWPKEDTSEFAAHCKQNIKRGYSYQCLFHDNGDVQRSKRLILPPVRTKRRLDVFCFCCMQYFV